MLYSSTWLGTSSTMQLLSLKMACASYSCRSCKTSTRDMAAGRHFKNLGLELDSFFLKVPASLLLAGGGQCCFSVLLAVCL